MIIGWVLTQPAENLKLLFKTCGIHTLLKSYQNVLLPTPQTDYSLWKAAGGLKSPKMSVPLHTQNGNSWARSPQENAEAFAMALIPNTILEMI